MNDIRAYNYNRFFMRGGQEMEVRPGTLNVAGIVGLGAACELYQDWEVGNRDREVSPTGGVAG